MALLLVIGLVGTLVRQPLIVQQVMTAMSYEGLIERLMIRAIKGLALDLLILCAVATLSLTAIGTHLVPFMLLAVAGIAWSVACFWLLAPSSCASGGSNAPSPISDRAWE